MADQRRTKFRGPTIPDSPLVIWPLPKYCLGQLDTVWAEILSWASGTKVFLTHSLFLINKDELSLYVLSGMMLFLWLLWGTRTLCYSFIRDLWIKSHKWDRCGFVLVCTCNLRIHLKTQVYWRNTTQVQTMWHYINNSKSFKNAQQKRRLSY